MFNADEVPESKESSYTLLPKGGYRVVIADVQFKYKQGDVNYTWENQNAQAREIGHQQLADLMFACGAKAFSNPQDLSALLMNQELYVELYHAKRKDTQADEVRIGGYWTHDGKQRKKNPKPIPVPPTAQAIASAPAQAPRNTQTQGAPGGHPAFDSDVPF
jgi:hypothetical protein